MATFSYAAMSTMALALPADLYQSRAVASVSGMSGTAAGLGTIGATYLIGLVADRFSFTPILLVASVVPLVGAGVVLLLVRNTAASGQGAGQGDMTRPRVLVLSGPTLFRSFFDAPRERRLGRSFDCHASGGPRRHTPAAASAAEAPTRSSRPGTARASGRSSWLSRRGCGSWRTAAARSRHASRGRSSTAW